MNLLIFIFIYEYILFAEYPQTSKMKKIKYKIKFNINYNCSEDFFYEISW